MALDLNADLGEGFGIWKLGDDLGLLPHLSSANVACGFHAGDPKTMMAVCSAATAHQVTIGAQVGYHDLVGFGRRRLDIAADDLTADIVYQVGALEACARASGAQVRYVKPHGALYNTAMIDPLQAAAIVEAIVILGGTLPLLGQPGSELEQAATGRGVRFVAEGFADRAYTASGGLVSRSEPNSVIIDEAAVLAQSLSFATGSGVTAVDGTHLDLRIESLCLHGDTPGAARLAQAVRAALTEADVRIAPFAG